MPVRKGRGRPTNSGLPSASPSTPNVLNAAAIGGRARLVAAGLDGDGGAGPAAGLRHAEDGAVARELAPPVVQPLPSHPDLPDELGGGRRAGRDEVVVVQLVDVRLRAHRACLG